MTSITFEIVEGQNLQTGAMRPHAIALRADGLPALTGDMGDVIFADGVRATALDAAAAAMSVQLRTVRDHAPQAFDASKVLASAQAAAARLAPVLDARTDAAWWLANADALAANPVRALMAP